MTKIKLLPRWCRFVGMGMAILATILFILNPDSSIEFNLGDPKGPLVTTVPALFNQSYGVNDFVWMSWIKNDLSNEFLFAIMLIAVYCIAFAKIKGEDEFSERIRLQSLVSAILWNSVFLLIANFLFYEGEFLWIMIFQFLSFLILFTIFFAAELKRQRSSFQYEE